MKGKGLATQLVVLQNMATVTRRFKSRFGEQIMNGLIWFLLVGLIAGWLAGVLVKGGGAGLIGDLVVGIVGALIGGYLFGSAGFAGGGMLGAILVATLGSVILLVLLRLIRRA